MTTPTEPQESQKNLGEEPGKSNTWDKMISSPEVLGAIAKIPNLIQANIDAKTTLTKTQMETQASFSTKQTKWLLVWTVVLVLVIVASVTWLAWLGKVSSDAVTFLLGTIVGAAFTFLRSFFPRGT